VAPADIAADSASEVALGIDIGGTFTDVVVAGADGVRAVVKVLTTPADPAAAAVAGAERALAAARVRAADVSRVVHGTTLATNTILERRGAPVAFVTTRGFRDLLALGRHARVEDERYDLFFAPPVPPVAPTATFAVPERIGPTGEVEVALDESAVADVAEALGRLGIQAVAVCLLHSYVNPAHELRVADLLRGRLGEGVDVVTSTDVWPEVREYERATTTLMSAVVGPVLGAYLRALEDRLRAAGVAAPLFVTDSAGGVMAAATARRRAVATIESGPAAGVVAAAVAGAAHGHDRVIAVDMGGTTAKAALVVDGEPGITYQFQVGGTGSFGTRRSGTGVPIRTPTVDLAEVGAGGGSIAWVDDTGRLRVGPRSAGADPGPAWYGRGGAEPTVTDASVALGYLDPAGLPDGGLAFDAGAAAAAVGELANRLGVDAAEAAAAVHDIADAAMAGAIHVVTVQRGVDPRGYALVSSGGAGPLHAARVAERFGIGDVVVVPVSGVASALGLLTADLRTDRVRTVLLADGGGGGGALDPAALEAQLGEVAAEAAAELAPGEAPHAGGVRFARSADVRFRGQSHELSVPLPDGPLSAADLDAVRDDFVRRHREAFGVGHPGPIEVVNLRVRATQPVAHPAFARPAAARTGAPPVPRTRRAWFGALGGWVDTAVHGLDTALVGRAIAGPALVESNDTTVLVPPGWTAVVAASGAVLLHHEGTSA
jgi:N-methylhydantoinase A